MKEIMKGCLSAGTMKHRWVIHLFLLCYIIYDIVLFIIIFYYIFIILNHLFLRKWSDMKDIMKGCLSAGTVKHSWVIHLFLLYHIFIILYYLLYFIYYILFIINIIYYKYYSLYILFIIYFYHIISWRAVCQLEQWNTGGLFIYFYYDLFLLYYIIYYIIFIIYNIYHIFVILYNFTG